MRRRRRHLTYANVMATIAVLLATGTSAWALTVTSSMIKDGTVQGRDVKDSTLQARDLATNSVGSAEVAAGAIGAAELGTGSVSGPKLAAGAVDGTKLGAGAVDGTKLAGSSVSSSHINAVLGVEILNDPALDNVAIPSTLAGAVTAPITIPCPNAEGKAVGGGWNSNVDSQFVAIESRQSSPTEWTMVFKNIGTGTNTGTAYVVCM